MNVCFVMFCVHVFLFKSCFGIDSIFGDVDDLFVCLVDNYIIVIDEHDDDAAAAAAAADHAAVETC